MNASATFAVRSFVPGDNAIALTEIVRACWHDAYESVVSRDTIDALFDGRIDMHGSWLWRRTGLIDRLVAVEATGEIVGLAEIGTLEPSVGELVSLYVTPQLQGKGIGTLLWQTACDMLRSAGSRFMEVWAIRGAKSGDFYRAHGCHEIAEGTLWVDDVEVGASGFGLSFV